MKNEKQKDEDDYIITDTLIKERGWTKALINKYLKYPDKTKTNPVYKCASPMKLYSLKRIMSIEETEEFKHSMELTILRKKAALRVTAKKREVVLRYIDTSKL